jgi:uncharacterized protein (DUF427 family)
MPRAIFNGEVIAESPETVVVEGNHYFPRAAVRDDAVQPSAETSWCPWKGQASYLDVQAGGERSPGAAWYYPEPKPKAEHIRDHVAFWRGVRVEA